MHPFAETPLPPNWLFSRLEVEAERISLTTTESLAANPHIVAMQSLMSRFLQDGRGALAVRKALHVAVERRLRVICRRISPPAAIGFPETPGSRDWHPLDHGLAVLVGGQAAPSGAWPSFRNWLSAITWCLVPPLTALYYLVRHGRRRHRAVSTQLLSTIPSSDNHWLPLVNAAKELGIWHDDSMLVSLPHAAPDRQLPVIAMDALTLPVGDWIRTVVGPAFRLSAGMLAILVRSHRPEVLEAVRESAILAYQSLDYWRLGFSVQARTAIDNTEYDQRHIVKAAILSRFGTRLYRWPTSQHDTPGVGLSYLGYAGCLSGGNYQKTVWGHSWSSQCEDHPIGILTFDRFISGGDRLDDRIATRIAGHLRAGRKVLVVFGPGMGGVAYPELRIMWRQILSIIWTEVETRDDWVVVFKPKLSRPDLLFAENDPVLDRMRIHPRYIEVDYPIYGDETCPPGWLIERMHLGFAIGSAVVEAATRGKPCLTYLPFVQNTPAHRMARDAGLEHADLGALKAAFLKFLNHPVLPTDTRDWYCLNFDQFGDDRALDRAAKLLLDTSDRVISSGGNEDSVSRKQ